MSPLDFKEWGITICDTWTRHEQNSESSAYFTKEISGTSVCVSLFLMHENEEDEYGRSKLTDTLMRLQITVHPEGAEKTPAPFQEQVLREFSFSGKLQIRPDLAHGYIAIDKRRSLNP